MKYAVVPAFLKKNDYNAVLAATSEPKPRI